MSSNYHQVDALNVIQYVKNGGRTGQGQAVRLVTNGRRHHRMNPEQIYSGMEKKNRKSSKNNSEVSYEKHDDILVWRNPDFTPANNDDYSSAEKVA